MSSKRRDRYVFVATQSGGAARYDRLLRRTRPVQLPDHGAVELGRRGKFRVCSVMDDEIRCEVRTTDAPDVALASGVFANGVWSFDGDAQTWADVDQYIVAGDSSSLLRIADGASPVRLEIDRDLESVREIPDSRLAVCTTVGSVIVCDPLTGCVGENLELEGKHTPTAARFRPGAAELWFDAGSTLVAVDTAHWKVLDAAGYEGEASIEYWNFVDDASAVVMSNTREVALIELKTMLARSATVLERPAAAVHVVGNDVYAIDASGAVERARLRQL